MRAAFRISYIYAHPLSRSLTSRICCKISSLAASTQQDKRCPNSYIQCDQEFLPWLRRKTGFEISSVLAVGFSSHGRSLFASESIRAGDCILQVPYTAQITTNNICLGIESLLVDDVDSISQLALVLLAEKKLGQGSEWAPYINCLPHINAMYNTMFWIKEELEMLQASSIYQGTINQKAYLKKQFLGVKPALEHFPCIFGDSTLEDFIHAYALIISRAWRTSKGISLIPFADFLNHDGTSEADLLSDDVKETSEVIADRDYVAGEQILIRYGKFPNSTLMLDFGFTLPHNIHDQFQVFMDLPKHDPLYTMKEELLHKHCFPINSEINSLESSRSSFIMREVKSPKGKGIPQALRAYARVLSVKSYEELKALEMEAAENDGRLARRPLKNKKNEIQAHQILLSQFAPVIQGHAAAVKDLESMDSPGNSAQLAVKRKMAIDLLNGELRVLKSACAWLSHYCTNVSTLSGAIF